MNDIITLVKSTLDYEGVKWVLKAIDKEGSRYHLNHIFSLGNHVFATDGHRLHAYRTRQVKIPKGAYLPMVDKTQILLMPKDDVTGPDAIQVFPRHKPHKIFRIESAKDVSIPYTEMVRKMDEGETLNLKYFEDMINGVDYSPIFRHFGQGCPVWMKNGHRSGLIMPMRM
jgi:hypothetical protein